MSYISARVKAGILPGKTVPSVRENSYDRYLARNKANKSNTDFRGNNAPYLSEEDFAKGMAHSKKMSQLKAW